MLERIVRTKEQILREAKTIAVVGASPHSHRTSNRVMRYLQQVGYRCIPVNPNADEVLGERCYPSLRDVPEHVDVVDVFRRPEFCEPVAEDAVAVGAEALWLQLGVRSAEARRVAEEAGLDYVEDACTLVVHRGL
jgi:predicted CoA-binding protein